MINTQLMKIVSFLVKNYYIMIFGFAVRLSAKEGAKRRAKAVGQKVSISL
jgi:hypothetical protein